MAIPLTGTLEPLGAFPIVDKAHVGGLGTAASNSTEDFDAAGAAAAALASANTYTDTGLGGKVDKITGKGLSTEDFTSVEKTKLAGIGAGAAVSSVNGGTGAVTITVNSLLPSQTGKSGKVLGTDGTNVSWVDQSGGTGSGDMLAANNLSELTNFATARANLGLGTAATQPATAFDAAGAASSALSSANSYTDAGLAGKVDKVTGKGLSTEDYTTAEKTKLSGIAANATANDTDANLKARANHTGTQAATTIVEDSTHRFATDTEKTTWNGKQDAIGFTPRKLYTTDLTVYCNFTSGSDSNDGLTSGTAFQTIQKAFDFLSTVDGGGNHATIQLADGTYTTAPTLFMGITAQANMKPVVGWATVTLKGNAASPSNVIVRTTSGVSICSSIAHTTLVVKDLRVETITGGYGIAASNSGYIEISNVVFGACASSQCYGRFGGLIWVNGNCQWTGNCAGAVHANSGKVYFLASTTQTVVGTPNYSVAFARADFLGWIQCDCTWSGGATGSRYAVSMNSVIQTFGKGATYFPGNALGTTATGGQYA